MPAVVSIDEPKGTQNWRGEMDERPFAEADVPRARCLTRPALTAATGDGERMGAGCNDTHGLEEAARKPTVRGCVVLEKNILGKPLLVLFQ